MKNRFPPSMFGASSLLVVFAVLCLTVFCLLTIGTARSELKLSEVSAEAITNYYKADSQAENIFSQLRSGNIPEEVKVEGNTYSYSCSISSTLDLYVEVQLNNSSWEVICWQPISSMR